MSACYWVLVTDDLFQAGMPWPDGLRLAGAEQAARYRVPPAAPHAPASSWRLVSDDGADPALDGKRAELILRYEAGVPAVAERHEVT